MAEELCSLIVTGTYLKCLLMMNRMFGQTAMSVNILTANFMRVHFLLLSRMQYLTVVWKEGAPPLKLRRERQEYLPDHVGKGSLLWNYEAETGLLWMWAGLSCFLSNGDGYVGELLELQQGCEKPFGSSRD